MTRKTLYVSPVIRTLAGLVLLILIGLFIVILALLFALSVPIDEGQEWSSRIPVSTLIGTYATAGYLRGGL